MYVVQVTTWSVPSCDEYPSGRSILTVKLIPQLHEFVLSLCRLGQMLDYLFHHNAKGTATFPREGAKLYLSWLNDATVMGNSTLGNKSGVLHHTRGLFKAVVSGKESKSTISHDQYLLMTGNDHGHELVQGVILAPPGGQSLWSQFKELLRAGVLILRSDTTRLSCGCELPIAFGQYISDGANVRNAHFRSSACFDIDCANVTPQLKALRQMMHEVLGTNML